MVSDMANQDWMDRHLAAFRSPRDSEGVHVQLYQAVHSMWHSKGWHEDGYASDYVVDIIRAARALLDMETGRLDCGTLDSFYCDALRACGEEP